MLTEKPQVEEPRGREYGCGVSGSDCLKVVKKRGIPVERRVRVTRVLTNTVNWKQEEPSG
jgi:hypothetical protein